MATRLATADSELLRLHPARSRGNHSCSLVVLDRPAGWDVDRIMDFVDARLADAPRYRQRVARVPFGLARSVWVDDPDFDLGFHVRRSALPAPGDRAQLAELVARLVDRPLEPGRPLWELYLIEGLEDGRLAVLSKSHHALIGGPRAVDLAQVLLSSEPAAPAPEDVPTWAPVTAPGKGVLVVDAVTSIVADPLELWRRSARAVALTERAASRVVATLASPLLRSPGGAAESFRVRRPSGSGVGLAQFSLARVRSIAADHGCTVNDVVLAVLCGALRSWIISSGLPLATADALRVIVPVAVRSWPTDAAAAVGVEVDGGLAGAGRTDDGLYSTDEPRSAEITSILIGMPVGEPNPRMRLAQIARETLAHRQVRPAVGARTLSRLSGFAPPTLHALGSRAARLLPPDSYDLVVTNAPGPQHGMYWCDGELREVYPVPALLDGQGLAVSLSSFDGTVYCGLTADRQAVPDVGEIGDLVTAAIDELENR